MADGVEGEELGAALLAPLEGGDRFEGDRFVLDDDGVEALFEGGVDRDLETRGHLELPRKQANDTRDLRRFAEAAGLELLHERLAHDEHVPRAGGDTIVLGLDAAERIEAAFQVVELAQVVVAR